MRELKFRIWNPTRKVLTAGSELRTLLSTTDEEFVNDFQINNMEWMQYTGLKDKKGKEIYEGDYVKIFWTGINEYSTEAISWDKDFLYFKYGNNPISEIVGDPFINFEVVGNIHKNPELK